MKPWAHGQVGVSMTMHVLKGVLVYSQALSGPAIKMDDPLVGLLFSLVAASAHIIVPAAVFNLKVHLWCL